MECAAVHDILSVCNAIGEDENRTGKTQLRRIVAMLTRLVARNESVSETASIYRAAFEHEHQYRVMASEAGRPGVEGPFAFHILSSRQPERSHVSCPLPDDILERLYGTITPTREMVEQNMDFLEDVERGQGVYIVLYKEGQPDQVFFAGYSFD